MTDDLSRVLADIDSLLPPGAPSGDLISPDAMRWSPVDYDDHPATVHGGTTTHTVRVTLERSVPLARGGWVAPSRDVYDLAATLQCYPHPDRYGVVTEHGWDGIEFFYPQVPATQPRYSGLVERRWMHGEAGPSQATLYPSAVEAEYAAAIDNLTRESQRTATNLQQLRDRHNQAQAVIEARRNRNTGPSNPRGIDGRARRHQHPTRSAASNASPATHGTATPATRGWLALIGEPEPWPAPVITRLADGALVVGFDPAWR